MRGEGGREWWQMVRGKFLLRACLPICGGLKWFKLALLELIFAAVGIRGSSARGRHEGYEYAAPPHSWHERRPYDLALRVGRGRRNGRVGMVVGENGWAATVSHGWAVTVSPFSAGADRHGGLCRIKVALFKIDCCFSLD
jgi:hypothetical protein